MSAEKSFDSVKNNKLFKNIGEGEVNSLFNAKNFVDVKEGDIIYKGGDNSENLYLLINGNVKIKFSGVGKGKKIISVESDQFFGEVEFMEGSQRRSSAVAYTDCLLYKIEKTSIKKLISENKQILANIEGTEIESDNITPEYFSNTIQHNQPLETSSDEINNNLSEQSFGVTGESPAAEKSELAWDFGPPEEVEELPDENIPVEKNKDDFSESDFSSWQIEPTPVTETSPEEGHTADDFNTKLNEEELQLGDISSFDNISFDEKEIELPKVDWSKTSAGTKATESYDNEEIDFSIRSSQLTVEQLHKIIEAAQKVNSNINLDDVLFSIVDAATDLTRADRGTLYVVDKEKNELWSKVLIGNDIQEIRMSIGEGIAGWVAQTGEVINLDDVTKDSRFNPEYDRTTGYYTKTMICFPIKNKHNEIIGVIQLLNSKRGEFSHLDEEILKALTINVALAIENANLIQQLLKNDRLSSLGKMANFIIQDIKKPILTIKQYVEHIKKKNVTPDIRMVLDMLMEQAESIADLVTTTISYSEGKVFLQTHQLSINKTLDEIIAMLAEFVETRNAKIFKKYDEDVIVNVDKKELYQCMLQITKNACDAMSNGGNIYFTTKRNDNSIEISIKDNGLGIPESIKDRIFEPFMSQGKKQGIGLGLSIAEKIVKDHGGSIRVESDLGEGAEFIISLPIHQKNS